MLSGPGIEAEHCIMESIEGTVILHPIAALCQVNGLPVGKSQRISQGRCYNGKLIVSINLEEGPIVKRKNREIRIGKKCSFEVQDFNILSAQGFPSHPCGAFVLPFCFMIFHLASDYY